ncbi:MAG: hypothetical protein E7615_08030 [Ruminococcaceae bacterium]|nr:hypothetical protein [Oscillospiraceae bacterium]
MVLDSLFGSILISVSEECTLDCINLIHRNGINTTKIIKKEGFFSFKVRLSKAKKVLSLLDKSGIKVYSIKGEGFPFLIKRYHRRAGIVIGALLFCLIIGISDNYVWQIQYSGNENIADSVVEQQLLDAGFGVGTYIPDVDFYSLCNVFLQNSEDFSFISVNMEGTTAKVELRERKIKTNSEDIKASNLVAKYSGQIESMTVYEGKTVIEKEDVVKEGELLVSGFLEKTYGFDIVRSRGSVYAYVTRHFEIDIPFEKTVKEYTGKKQTDKELIFFGNNFSFGKNIDGSYDKYDTVTDRERLVLFDRIKLPMILNKTTVKEYKESYITLTEDEARNEAEKRLTELMAEELLDADILERKVTSVVTEKSYKLVCDVYCITDIALEKEITVD